MIALVGWSSEFQLDFWLDQTTDLSLHDVKYPTVPSALSDAPVACVSGLA